MKPSNIATKDYFAGLAMQAILSNCDIPQTKQYRENIAILSYVTAEQMMMERAERQAKTDNL